MISLLHVPAVCDLKCFIPKVVKKNKYLIVSAAEESEGDDIFLHRGYSSADTIEYSLGGKTRSSSSSSSSSTTTTTTLHSILVKANEYGHDCSPDSIEAFVLEGSVPLKCMANNRSHLLAKLLGEMTDTTAFPNLRHIHVYAHFAPDHLPVDEPLGCPHEFLSILTQYTLRPFLAGRPFMLDMENNSRDNNCYGALPDLPPTTCHPLSRVHMSICSLDEEDEEDDSEEEEDDEIDFDEDDELMGWNPLVFPPPSFSIRIFPFRQISLIPRNPNSTMESRNDFYEALKLKLLHLPNLHKYEGFHCPAGWMQHVCSVATLKHLRWEDKMPFTSQLLSGNKYTSMRHEISTLISALGPPSTNTAKHKKRKLNSSSLCQLETLHLHKARPRASDILSLCQVLQHNTTICDLHLTKLNLRVLDSDGQATLQYFPYIVQQRTTNSVDATGGASVIPTTTNTTAAPTNAGHWEPFLEILRHNRTLKTMEIVLRVWTNYTTITTPFLEETWDPYMQEELLSILTTQRNYTINKIDFGISYPKTDRHHNFWKHSGDVKYRLDLNYYGLSPFVSSTDNNVSGGAVVEGFPEAVIAAAEIEENAENDRETLLTCLFRLCVGNPNLLVNSYLHLKL